MLSRTMLSLFLDGRRPRLVLYYSVTQWERENPWGPNISFPKTGALVLEDRLRADERRASQRRPGADERRRALTPRHEAAIRIECVALPV
jgi:hypothetical protein